MLGGTPQIGYTVRIPAPIPTQFGISWREHLRRISHVDLYRVTHLGKVYATLTRLHGV